MSGGSTSSGSLAHGSSTSTLLRIPGGRKSGAIDDAPAQFEAALTDRYRIEGELGRGGMATACLAVDRKHTRTSTLAVSHPFD